MSILCRECRQPIDPLEDPEALLHDDVLYLWDGLADAHHDLALQETRERSYRRDIKKLELEIQRLYDVIALGRDELEAAIKGAAVPPRSTGIF